MLGAISASRVPRPAPAPLPRPTGPAAHQSPASRPAPVHHRAVRDRYQVGVPDAVGEPASSAATASASRVLPMPPIRRRSPARCSASAAASAARSASRPTNDVGRAQPPPGQLPPGQGAGRHHTAREVSREDGQRPPVASAELAQQQGDVTLHVHARDERPGRDLGIRQVLGDTSEHFPVRHHHRGRRLLLHDVILTGTRRLAKLIRDRHRRPATALQVSWTSQVSHGWSLLPGTGFGHGWSQARRT